MAYLHGCFTFPVLQCGSDILAYLLHRQAIAALRMIFDLKSELVIPGCALGKVMFF